VWKRPGSRAISAWPAYATLAQPSTPSSAAGLRHGKPPGQQAGPLVTGRAPGKVTDSNNSTMCTHTNQRQERRGCIQRTNRVPGANPLLGRTPTQPGRGQACARRHCTAQDSPSTRSPGRATEDRSGILNLHTPPGADRATLNNPLRDDPVTRWVDQAAPAAYTSPSQPQNTGVTINYHFATTQPPNPKDHQPRAVITDNPLPADGDY